MTALKIGIILASTRPGRRGDQVANWVLEQSSRRTDATYELLDLAAFALPQLDEELPPARGTYANEHTKAWSAQVDRFDAFVIVTPEYNHSIPGVLKTALDFLHREWINKSVGFVSYGFGAGGVRAVEHLRTIVGELQMADVRQQVAISIKDDFIGNATLGPMAHHEKALSIMFDQVVSWGTALRGIRESV